MMAATSTRALSFFAKAPLIPPDAIFALTAQYLKDGFPEKVNLGQGTYRDERGQPWVLTSVREARRRLDQQGLNHEYLPILGLAPFRTAVCEAVLGPDFFSKSQKKIASCQSLSGTGALHLAGQLLARCRSPRPAVYIPEPTWSNHHQVFSAIGFECRSFKYYDFETKALDMKSYSQMLQTAEPGSVIILHACAHNPTGCDPTEQQWRDIGSAMKERGLFPLFDAAYLGFNSGDFDKDAFPVRHFVGDLGMEAAVCSSFAKNMGLYGERVGCVMVCTHTEETGASTASLLEQIQRSEVSNPPAYGAKIAHMVLSDPELRGLWKQDLVEMSGRIRAMRQALYDALVRLETPGSWNHIVDQSGMFSFLGLEPEIVRELKEKHHIYMADNSRISMAGLNQGNVDYVAKSISECVRARVKN